MEKRGEFPKHGGGGKSNERRSPQYDAVFPAPFAWIGIRLHENALAAVCILGLEDREHIAPASPLAQEAVRQLTNYFQDAAWHFELPLHPAGSAFQQRVREALRQIPPGASMSYGLLAKQLGSGARAVGNACRANPIPVIIPCHRVVGARSLGGYMGLQPHALDYKRWLLRHEKCQFAKML
ncbi:MAG: methylated-DNA--[protein]-cysteine S-methyltransferase [Gammaproteobacteria bacterium]|nr:methylated-DNA--[protein]-cysteine S-methyltransferase [Gammaproteobacteria bacterium]